MPRTRQRSARSRAQGRRKTPDLHFVPGPNSGFTPAGIAAFDNLRPAAVVRELIQNALDAARSANSRPAIVRFRLSHVERSNIPGMKSYERAFKQAVQSQKKMMGRDLATQAELVCKRIQRALAQEPVEVLSVYDNGVGLDEQRMTALLSDGMSVKDGGATGTYGNGHSSAIPASDLRYILYGGVTNGRSRIAAGHAVLASHYVPGAKHLQGGDGFFVLEPRPSPTALYQYASANQIPALISRDLDRIQNASGHGTAVIIPAFNHFLDRRRTPLWQVVAHAASANFFVAIEEGELEVEVQDARNGAKEASQKLNRSTLSQVLEEHRDKKRAKAFLSGLKAFESHKTFQKGKAHRIKTSAGEIDVRLDPIAAGTPRIDLCRNGMWITNRVPHFYGKFTDRAPFHAVLSLKAEAGDRLHDYVRIAEGPLHDSLELKRLEEDDRRACRNALGEIIEWLRQHTAAVESEAFASDEFLTLDFGDGGPGGTAGTKAFRGAPVVIGRRPAQQLQPYDDEGPIDGGGGASGGRSAGKNSSKGEKRRPALPALVQAASRPAGTQRRHILLHFPRGCEAAQLRLLVDEGLDATCDRHGMDDYLPAKLSNVKIDGEPAAEADLEHWNGEAVGVKLGDIAADTTTTVETDFAFDGDFANLPETSLRIEVFRTPMPKPDRPSGNATDSPNA